MAVERVAIAGAGRMGIPMAQVLAMAGYRVDLMDLKPRDDAGRQRLADQMRQEIAGNLELLVAEGIARPGDLDAVLGRVALRDGVGPWVGAADVVIEALPETRAAKEPFYRAARPLIRPGALTCSATSTFSPDELADWVPEPARFMGTHWLNPAFLIPLVEVAVGRATAPQAVAEMQSFLESAGKVPVVCRPQAGFIIPRLQAMLMNEVARMAEEEVAEPAELDRAIRYGLGFRYLILGVLEFIDWGGVDTLYHAGHYLHEKLGDPKFLPPPSVQEKMAAGHIGAKVGQGYYDWRSPAMQGFEADRKRQYIRLLRWLGLLPGA